MIAKRIVLSVWVVFMLIVIVGPVSVSAQEKKEKHRPSFKDSLDGAFDVSDWIIDYNGFVPVPAIITDPAFGNFGIAVVPVFIKQNAPKIVNGKVHPIAPNVTAAFGGYTLNDSWAAGFGRTAVIPKWGVKYKVIAGYGNINMNFYHTFKLLGEKKFDFNIKTIPVSLYLGKQLRNPNWTFGIEYTYAHSKLRLNAGDATLIDSIASSKDYSSSIGHLGILGEFDNRDNTFTPNKGFKIYVNAMFNNNIFGSDYNYEQIEGAAYWYIPVKKNWVSGARFDMQQAIDDPPFYLKPFLDMRGIPTGRYQGKTTMLLETEQRFDVYKRWSVIAYGGLAKAFDDYSDISDVPLVYTYGTGFRYLIARKLNLRMGVDLAKGPDSWGYYIVFGSAWMRQ